MHNANYTQNPDGSCFFELFDGLQVTLTPINLQLWGELNAIPLLPNGSEDNIEYILRAISGLCIKWGALDGISYEALETALESEPWNLDILNAVLMMQFPKKLEDSVIQARVLKTFDPGLNSEVLTVELFGQELCVFRPITLKDLRTLAKQPKVNGQVDNFGLLFLMISLLNITWMNDQTPVTPMLVRKALNHRIEDVLLLEEALSGFTKRDFQLSRPESD